MTPTPRTAKTTTTSTEETPSAAASRYQQLRSHLAELKLAAAAEALPAVLDQAAVENLSLTVALERLLAVEVEASTARRLAGRLRFACLPTPATLADFDIDAAAGIDQVTNSHNAAPPRLFDGGSPYIGPGARPTAERRVERRQRPRASQAARDFDRSPRRRRSATSVDHHKWRAIAAMDDEPICRPEPTTRRVEHM